MKVFLDFYEPSPSMVVLGLCVAVIVGTAVLVLITFCFPKTVAALAALGLVATARSGGRPWL